MSNLPWLGPGAVASLLLALALGGRVGRALRTTVGVGSLLIAAVGLIVSATLTPLRGTLEVAAGPGACDLSRTALIPLSQLLSVNDASLNVLLFVPLGVAIGLIPPSRRRWIVILLAVTLPVAIEWSQLVFTDLLRGCESGDVIDNLTGLFVGWIGIAIARSVARWLGGTTRDSERWGR